MIFLLLCMPIFGHEILWLNSGKKLVCDRYLVRGDRLVILRLDQSYSIDVGKVDWERTRNAAMHEDPEPEGDRLFGGAGQTGAQPLPAINRAEPEAITDLVIEKLSVKGMDVVDLLRFLADMAGINIVIDGSVPNQKATFHFRNIAWDDAFRIVLQNTGLAHDNLYGAVRVRPYP